MDNVAGVLKVANGGHDEGTEDEELLIKVDLCIRSGCEQNCQA
jgi:hypothetical protein